MSADLWAAFGNGEDPANNPWSQLSPIESQNEVPSAHSKGNLLNLEPQRHDQSLSSTLQSPWATSDSVHQGTVPARRLDDQVPTTSHHEPSIQSAWKQEHSVESTMVAPARGHQVDNIVYRPNYEDESWGDFSKPEPADPWASTESGQASEVFWDAEAETVDDDDFGDFEKPTEDIATGLAAVKISEPAISAKQAEVKNNSQRRPASARPAGSSINGRSRSTQSKSSAAGSASRSKETPVDELEANEDDDWDDWSPKPTTKTQYTDSQVLQPTKKPAKPAESIPKPQASSQPPRSSSRSRAPPPTTLPPTNIPPPSILISLLTQLITTLPSQIGTAISTFTSTSTSTTSNKALSTAIRKCLSALRVAGRIIAGRKQRWKRDTNLAASMRIGQAGAGGKGGMKLSGVDRNEVKREDREVAEFVRVWSMKVGAVRKALAGVQAMIVDAETTGNGRKLEIPAIGEGMVVRTAADGVKFGKGCTLCGLKREERVDKVDVDVFDGFDEWWVEYWGHTECRTFWYQHEKYLQQR